MARLKQVRYIVVHCSATAEGKAFTAADIDRWHKAQGWQGIGYHYVVLLDGTVQQGRKETEQGAHVAGYNDKSIGVCYIGGLSSDGKTPKDTRTDAQKAALLALLKRLHRDYPKAHIVGHRNLAAKACPSFDAQAEYEYI